MSKRFVSVRAAARLLVLALCGGTLAACGGGAGSSGRLVSNNGACLQSDLTPGPGSAATHGSPQRSDSDVTVTQEGGQFVARSTVTLQNDFGGAQAAQLGLSTGNGDIEACAGGRGGYGIVVSLEGRGSSDQEARAALQTMTVSHTDSLSSGTLQIATTVNFADPRSGSGLPVPIGTGGSSQTPQRGASITALVPGAASYALTPGTSNGNVIATGLSGSSAKPTTSNGNIGIDGNWDGATLKTSSGVVEVSGNYASLSVTDDNGPIEAELATLRSLDATLSTSNGPIEVALGRSGDPGFDLSAQTTNGTAEVSVGGTQAVGSQSSTSVHQQTPDYGTHGVQVKISASTSNGDAEIHD
jgi:hypothetical protein